MTRWLCSSDAAPEEEGRGAGDGPHEDECEVDTIEDSDVKGVILVHEAVVHEVRVWPDMDSSEAVDVCFPLVVAAGAVGGAL